MPIFVTRGFTLVELMIAMLLGLFLTAGVLYVFTYNKTTYQVQEGLARVQETGRFLHFYLSRNIRMAGYSGCVGANNLTINNLVDSPTEDMALDGSTSVTGSDGSGGVFTPAAPTALGGVAVLANTDILTLRFADPLNIKLQVPMNNPNNPLVVGNRYGIAAGDVIIVTDCEVGDMVMAGASSNAAAITHTVANNTTNDLSKIYTDEATIAKFQSYHYYLKDTGRTTTTGQAINALYQMDINGDEQELAEGVEDMQILYGVDANQDGTADTYSNAATIDAASNWPNVKSVRVNLLLSTVNEVSPSQQAYRYNGTTGINPGNNKLHREWRIHTTLRNRTLSY